jgi:hypothetical protein
MTSRMVFSASTSRVSLADSPARPSLIRARSMRGVRERVRRLVHERDGVQPTAADLDHVAVGAVAAAVEVRLLDHIDVRVRRVVGEHARDLAHHRVVMDARDVVHHHGRVRVVLDHRGERFVVHRGEPAVLDGGLVDRLRHRVEDVPLVLLGRDGLGSEVAVVDRQAIVEVLLGHRLLADGALHLLLLRASRVRELLGQRHAAHVLIRERDEPLLLLARQLLERG